MDFQITLVLDDGLPADQLPVVITLSPDTTQSRSSREISSNYGLVHVAIDPEHDIPLNIRIEAPGSEFREDFEIAKHNTARTITVPLASLVPLAPASLDRHITAVRFRSGDDVTIPAPGVTVVVGPNNCGKTQLLKDLLRYASWSGGAAHIAESVEISQREPPHWKLRAWLAKRYQSYTISGASYLGYVGSHLEVNKSRHDHATGRMLTHMLTVDERLQLSQPQTFSRITESPNNIVDYALRDPAITKRLSDEFSQRFGAHLIPLIDPQVSLRLGDAAGAAMIAALGGPGEGPSRKAASEMPSLADAGHGMRSYAAMLLALEACPHPILLVDEPEAFLHPPHAKHLGTVLAQYGEQRQVIVATHSADVLAGIVTHRRCPVQIIRLTRTGDTSRPTIIDPATFDELTRQPYVDSRELLASAFHDGAVLCEADSDRRFYSHYAGDADVAFLACNGKGGIARAATILSKLGVPTAAVVDFDALANEGELSAILQGLGASEDTASSLLKSPEYRTVKEAVQRQPPLSADELIESIRAILHTAESSPQPSLKTLTSEIGTALAKSRLGYEAKRHGIAALTGQVHSACSRLLARLAELGLFIVPHGELEGWWRGGSPEKARWIVDWWEKRDDEATFGGVRAWVDAVLTRIKQRPQPVHAATSADSSKTS